jgi:hypothetical protein
MEQAEGGGKMSRRALFKTTVAAMAGLGFARPASVPARTAAPLALPGDGAADTFDFETTGVDGWTAIDGQWTVEEMPGAPSGRKVLVQRAIRNPFDVIVAPPGPYIDVDVSVKFKPISGREDASAGIVLRFADGHYYVVRANALEDNFRLYAYDRGRRQLATASVKPPALGQWHSIRVVAVGDTCRHGSTGRSISTRRIARPCSSTGRP